MALAKSNWDYLGVFPDKLKGSMWGFRGIKSYTGNPYPIGILSTEYLDLVTPSQGEIDCKAINTFGFTWLLSTDAGETWEILENEHKSYIIPTYSLGSHGEYLYRCVCVGHLGTFTTEPIKITVTEPQVTIELRPQEHIISLGSHTRIDSVIWDSETYIKSHKWYQRYRETEEEAWLEWAEIPETGLDHTFVGNALGFYEFRFDGVQFDDVIVSSEPAAVQVVEVTEEE